MNITDELLRQAAPLVRQAMLSSLPAPEDCDHRFSPAFLRKMRALLRRQRHPRAYRLLRQAAGFILAVLVSVGTWLAVDMEARAAFVQWAREFYETHIVYRFAGEVAEKQVYRPTWLPEGYWEVGSSGASVVYLNDANEMLVLEFFTTQQGNSFLIAPEGTTLQSAEVHGRPADFYLSTDPKISNNLVWMDEDATTFFYLSGHLEENIMLHIAESIFLWNPTK